MIYSVISYNQEAYILETLESIKLQVINYGQDELNRLFVYDDGSSDATVAVADRWLEMNRDLFADVAVFESPCNQGIARNVSRAIQGARNEDMKIVAADDLVGPNNIYSILPDEGVVFTPCVCFNDKGVYETNLYYFLRMHSAEMKDALVSYIQDAFSIRNIFEAPGSFISGEIYADPALLDVLAEWVYHDDAPMWRYLFFDKEETPKVKITFTPFMMYRVGTGVSTSTDFAQASAYREEGERLFAAFFPEQSKPFFRRSLPAQIDFVMRKYIVKYLPVLSSEKKAMIEEYKAGVNAAVEYLADVRRNALRSAGELGVSSNAEEQS